MLESVLPGDEPDVGRRSDCRDAESMKAPSIGRCVYCDRSDTRLSREHIVPLGLNGEWVLHDASCLNCARLIARIEHDALRNAFIGPRAALGMRTRRPNQHQKLFPLQVESAGKRRIIQIPIEDYPVYMALPQRCWGQIRTTGQLAITSSVDECRSP